MKTNLNFKVDTVVKGIIYPRELIEEELKKKIESKNLFVTKDSYYLFNRCRRVSNVIGLVKGFSIDEDGLVCVDFDLLPELSKLEKCSLPLTVSCEGRLKRCGIYSRVSCFRLVNMFFPPALSGFTECEKCNTDFSVCENYNEGECLRKKRIKQSYMKIVNH